MLKEGRGELRDVPVETFNLDGLAILDGAGEGD